MMRRFTQLYRQLDETNRTNDKLSALEAYFQAAPPADAVWGLAFLTGRKFMRAISHRHLRQWAAQVSQLPMWLINESYDAVGDLSETLALVLDDHASAGSDQPLADFVQTRLLPLQKLTDDARQEMVTATWRSLDRHQRFVFHKLLSGNFRVGVGRRLVVRALAQVARVEPAIMDHRLLQRWQPTADDFQKLLRPPTHERDPAQPYPFHLAHALDGPPDDLGTCDRWVAEWKWDGIRAQLIRRGDQTLLWSRGEEMVGEQFHEIIRAGADLPDGTVLDGEVLAWEDDHVLPFHHLQTRIGRKKNEPRLWEDVPVILMAYDLLEWSGDDLRATPLQKRHQLLQQLFQSLSNKANLKQSEILKFSTWPELSTQRQKARDLGVEGVMIKERNSVYQAGRVKGSWWKWKNEPYTLDAVLVQAQRGHGKRASLYTDYTFAIWDGDQLVPVAKAYSGLTDDEIQQVDGFVREHTTASHGPVRVVKPQLVFELAFEGIAESNRHKAGFGLRFPRMLRWRHDKQPSDADTLATLRDMYQN